jgi:carbamoyl-phosphate synthase/aspartate carbamoyltransferase
MVGDMKNGRTVHSLAKLLSLYDVRINFVSPQSLALPVELKSELDQAGLVCQEYAELTDDIIARTDVLYVTRIQKERFTNLSEYESVKNSFCIRTATLKCAKPTMIVMHPLPRVNEIDPEVDLDPRAAYFRQMKYGLYVRMGLLALIMTK